MIEEAKVLGKPQIKKDETLTFDFFLESNVIVTKYLTRFSKDELQHRAEERRILAKNE